MDNQINQGKMKTIEESGCKNYPNVKAILIREGHYGAYIPHLVANEFAPFGGSSQCTGHFDGFRKFTFDWSDVAEESVLNLQHGFALLKHGHCDEYWQSWEDVLNNLKIEIDGEKYHMVQNQDVWLVPEECMDELEEWII